MQLFPRAYPRRADSKSNETQTSRKAEDSFAGKTSASQDKFTPSDMPAFQHPPREENQRNLETVRVNYNAQSLSLEPVEVSRWKHISIMEVMTSFPNYAKIAAKKGSRVARMRLDPRQNKLKNMTTSQEVIDEAWAIIYHEYGIPPERVTFGMATRVTHEGAIQLQLWMDIDFG